MKTLKLILLLGIFALASCSKEKFNEFDVDLNHQLIKDIELITLQDGAKNSSPRTLLGFMDEEHFENVYLLLEELVDKHNEAFLEVYGHLDDDALNEKEEAIGFDEFKPLRELEKQIGFLNSMRLAYAIAEKEWLDNEFLDPETDPSNQYGYCELEMTLLNDFGEVKIGESLYSYSNDGYVKFADADLSKLSRYSSGDMEVLNEPNVVSFLYSDFLKSSSDCSGWVSKTYYDRYKHNRQVKKRVYIRAMSTRVVTKSKIWSYRQRSNGTWRSHRMRLEVANQCYLYDNDCNRLAWQQFSGWQSKRRTSVTVRNTNWGAFLQYRAKNEESVYGYFKYAGNDKARVLAW